MNYPKYAHGGYVDTQGFKKEYLAPWDILKTTATHMTASTISAKPELTKEEKEEILNKYIEENKIEHDEKHLYLYKKVSLENKADNMMFEIGKTYVESVNGFRIKTMEDILSDIVHTYFYMLGGHPQNPSILFEKPNYKILKLKINKEHINYDLLGREIINSSQLEVIEEVDLSPKIKYEITSLQRQDDGSYFYGFTLKNIYLTETIQLTFKDKINQTQEEIQNRIKQELEIMQIEYDQYKLSSGSLEL